MVSNGVILDVIKSRERSTGIGVSVVGESVDRVGSAPFMQHGNRGCHTPGRREDSGRSWQCNPGCEGGRRSWPKFLMIGLGSIVQDGKTSAGTSCKFSNMQLEDASSE